MVKPRGDRMACRYCGKTLFRNRLRESVSANPEVKQFGRYGDGKFCGLRCGYRFAVQKCLKEVDCG